MKNVNIIERFEAKYIPVPFSGCWLWTGGLMPHGYGKFQIPTDKGQRGLCAHRYAYETFRGPIPQGLTLDHSCRVRSCVNPWHLEPMTRGKNVLIGVGPTAINARKTHCPYGHPYSHKDRWQRRCHTCQTIQWRRARGKNN
jgi:hypothetical protein